MINYVKEPHTAIFTGPTSCGKTQRVLDLIEQVSTEHHFDNIVILCSTLSDGTKLISIELGYGKMTTFFRLEPKGNLCSSSSKSCRRLFSGEETLFVVDDMIADETLDKRRNPLLELSHLRAPSSSTVSGS